MAASNLSSKNYENVTANAQIDELNMKVQCLLAQLVTASLRSKLSNDLKATVLTERPNEQ